MSNTETTANTDTNLVPPFDSSMASTSVDIASNSTAISTLLTSGLNNDRFSEQKSVGTSNDQTLSMAKSGLLQPFIH